MPSYILIDPESRTVREDRDYLSETTLKSLIGCRNFETLRLPSGDIVWFDGSEVVWDVPLDGLTIAGVLIMGTRCVVSGPIPPQIGLPTSCSLTVAQCQALIEWKPQRTIIGDTCTQTPSGFEIAYVLSPP